MSDPANSKPTRARRTVEERLAAAKASEARAAARLERKKVERQKYEAVQKQRDRKHDTRRKIIAGALALEHMRHDASFAAAFRDLLNTYVTKEPERALFGLGTSCPVPPAAPATVAPTPTTVSPASPPITVSPLGGMRIGGQAHYAPLRDPAAMMRKLGTK